MQEGIRWEHACHMGAPQECMELRWYASANVLCIAEIGWVTSPQETCVFVV